MPPDFSGQNLRGHSFKGQNLTGANFSYADIQGADFTGALLIGANFSHAKAGLQKRWAIFLVVVSWLLSGLSGLLSGFISFIAVLPLILDNSKSENQIAGLTAIVIVPIFFFITIRRGIQAGFGAVVLTLAVVLIAAIGIILAGGDLAQALAVTAVLALAIALAIAGTLAVTGILAVAIAIVVVVARDGTLAAVMAGTIAVAGAVAVARNGARDGTLAAVVAGNVAVAGALAIVLVSTYISWRTLQGDEKHTIIRKIAIAFSTYGGTSFRKADLTDANFTKATLKSTDFRNANLIRTCWHFAKQLDRVRPGITYLQNEQVRQLVITGEGKNKNFDYLDLRGLNLREANLKNASFIEANLYQANLQNANLSGAILVRKNFERADLRGACLTRSCIQDWIISRGTKLDGIVCDCIFLKWIDGDKRDQMPHRGKFKKGGFVLFAKYILDTIDIYHNQDINPRLALTVLKKMSRDYDEPLDIVAVGKRGDKVFIKVKLSETVEPEQFKEDYFSRYEDGFKLISSSSKSLPSVDELVENKLTEIASDKTDEISNINVTYVEYLNTPKDIVIQGELTVESINTGGDTINQSGSFGIGVNKGEVHAEKIAGTINEAQQQNLVEAAAEIQQLLEQLNQSYPTDTMSGKMALAAEATQRIENNPTLMKKVVSSLKAGGTAALEQLLSHPAASFVIAALEDWYKNNQ